VADVRFGPGGRIYATVRRSGDRYVFRLFATTARLPLQTPPPVPLPVSGGPGSSVDAADALPLMAFSPDGGTFCYRVSAPGKGTATRPFTLWDLRHGRVRSTVDLPGRAVSALAFSPDGRTLAVAGDAGSLQLWDVPALQPLGGPLTTPGERIDSLSFGADGGSLYAGSAHVPLQRYVVTPGHAVERVCARAGGGLTRAQWRTYLLDAG
jgi:WD40 repeat protein